MRRERKRNEKERYSLAKMLGKYPQLMYFLAPKKKKTYVLFVFIQLEGIALFYTLLTLHWLSWGVKYNNMSTLQFGVTLCSSSPIFLPSHSLTPRNGFPTPKTNSLKNPFRLAHCTCRTYSHGVPRMSLFNITCSATSPNLNKVCSFLIVLIYS